MMRRAVLVLTLTLLASAAHADPMSCALDSVKAQPGLTVSQAGDVLTVQWDGDRNQQLRMQFALRQGTPTIHELAVRRAGGTGGWGVVAADAIPEYRITSGLRRMSNQQMAPLRGLGVELTNEIVDLYRWDPFWDAPLDVGAAANRSSNPPPAQGIANQPGLPRKSDEVTRASAVYAVTACTVKTDGSRVLVSFPGVRLGVFSGELQYTIFKGSNLIQQDRPGDDHHTVGGVQISHRVAGHEHRWRCSRRLARHCQHLAGVPLRRREQ